MARAQENLKYVHVCRSRRVPGPLVRRARGLTAAVVYADNDPVVINHPDALATSGADYVDAVAADVGKSAAVLAAVRPLAWSTGTSRSA